MRIPTKHLIMSPSINTAKEIMKRSATFIVASGVFFWHTAVAQPQENVAEILSSANNIVYVDFATGFIQLSLSINYERTWEDFGIRVGFGQGVSFEVGSGYGGMAMVNYFPVAEHKFELGAGVSVIREDPEGHQFTQTKVYPAASMCYRIQPNDTGLFFRVGFSYVYYHGFPIAASLGLVF
jgi:hypothetical protein